ncbi:MAG TPA: sigma factor-like helix-turn-helix DNA-binding protein, partial [Myxococcota bacterium]|nr:sigma factor-like helix-turn-helix DNA-binding protein [Myxococcota bacterium]
RRVRVRPRGKTVSAKRITREDLRVGALMYPPVDIPRPQTRGECRDEMRPCPWVACKHHLYLDINPDTGSIILNFPDLEPWELQHTCAIDVAERGGITLEATGEILNLTRERIRQLEVRGLLKLKMRARELELDAA